MKRLLTLSALLLFSMNGFTEENDLGGGIKVLHEVSEEGHEIKILCIAGYVYLQDRNGSYTPLLVNRDSVTDLDKVLRVKTCKRYIKDNLD